MLEFRFRLLDTKSKAPFILLVQGVSKKALFCGFDIPGGNAMISWNQSQSVPQGDKRTAKERTMFH